MDYLKPMLPTLAKTIPKGDNWNYEVKYDGFRAITYVSENKIEVISRNLKPLHVQFPEIIDYFSRSLSQVKELTPFIIDGELAVLKTSNSANFEVIQQRGRLKSKLKIDDAVKMQPASFLAFDLLMLKGLFIREQPFLSRKVQLHDLFSAFPQDPRFQYIVAHSDPIKLWSVVNECSGEGIIAKDNSSIWTPGVRTTKWLKIKNLRIASVFITGYDPKNSYFHVGVLNEKEILPIGVVGIGFTKEEREALIAITMKNKTAVRNGIVQILPSICIEIEFLELNNQKLRHPRFRRFRMDKQWEECTWQAIQKVAPN